jgi:hypothetical protein
MYVTTVISCNRENLWGKHSPKYYEIFAPYNRVLLYKIATEDYLVKYSYYDPAIDQVRPGRVSPRP